MKNMEQNFNNRGNGYGQNHNNNVNNNQGGMNARPEVVTCAQSSGKSTFNKVAQHINGNKTAYGVGIGVVALTGLGFLAYKKGWIPGLKKKAKKEPAPAATAEPKPAQEAAGESK